MIKKIITALFSIFLVIFLVNCKTETGNCEGGKHELITYVVLKQTCTEYGKKISVCKKCDHSLTESIQPDGHTWDNGVVTKESNCTVKGNRKHICTVCNAVKNEDIECNDTHVYSKSVISGGESVYCTENCTCKVRYTCDLCSHSYETNETIPGRKHTVVERLDDHKYCCKNCNAIVTADNNDVVTCEHKLEGKKCTLCHYEYPSRFGYIERDDIYGFMLHVDDDSLIEYVNCYAVKDDEPDKIYTLTLEEDLSSGNAYYSMIPFEEGQYLIYGIAKWNDIDIPYQLGIGEDCSNYEVLPYTGKLLLTSCIKYYKQKTLCYFSFSDFLDNGTGLRDLSIKSDFGDGELSSVDTNFIWEAAKQVGNRCLKGKQFNNTDSIKSTKQLLLTVNNLNIPCESKVKLRFKVKSTTSGPERIAIYNMRTNSYSNVDLSEAIEIEDISINEKEQWQIVSICFSMLYIGNKNLLGIEPYIGSGSIYIDDISLETFELDI